MIWCSSDLVHISPWLWGLLPSSQKTCRNSIHKLGHIWTTQCRALGFLNDKGVAMMCCNHHLCGLFYSVSGVMWELCCSLPEWPICRVKLKVCVASPRELEGGWAGGGRLCWLRGGNLLLFVYAIYWEWWLPGNCLGQCEFPSAKTVSQTLLTVSNVDHQFWLAVEALTQSRRTWDSWWQSGMLGCWQQFAKFGQTARRRSDPIREWMCSGCSPEWLGLSWSCSRDTRHCVVAPDIEKRMGNWCG